MVARRSIGRAWLGSCLWVLAAAGPSLGVENLLANGDASAGTVGWTLSGRAMILTGAHCLPSQQGNPFFALDVFGGQYAYIEQAVQLIGDATLRFRTFGQLDATRATISVFDESGTEHVLDQFDVPRLIDHYEFPGPVFFCTGNSDEDKEYQVTGFAGQQVRIRLAATSSGFDGTFGNFDDIELLGDAAASLTASTVVSPAEVAPDDEFTMTSTVANTGNVDLVNVHPTGPVQIELADGAEVEQLSGPEPAVVGALAKGASAQIVYRFKALKEGSATLVVEIAGEDGEGNQVLAEAICAIPGASVEGRSAAPPCNDTVTIQSPCTVELEDVSPPIYVSQKTGRILDANSNEPVACGLSGPCPLSARLQSQIAEVKVVPLESEARRSTKNVGQEVKLEAAVDAREGLALSTLRWTVPGETIESYTDVSGYLSGNPDALEFKHEPVQTDWETETQPGAEGGGDKLRFFWKDTGTFEVKVEAVVVDEEENEFTCEAMLELEVERNRTDPDRQAEDFFTSCCSDEGERERVRMEHLRWHNANDAAEPHPGDDWLNFHRAVTRVFDQWREFFGYPSAGKYDGTAAFPSSENGYTLVDAARGSSEPRCPRPADPRLGAQPLQAYCPMPPWFTPGGDGSPRPPDTRIDIAFNIFGDYSKGFFLAPQCFKARDYNSDRCWPVGNFVLDEPAEEVTCQLPAGLQEPVDEVPKTERLNVATRAADLVDVGQVRLSDFRDNAEMGCIVTKSWHVDMHVLTNGSMRSTATSPKDPVFYRVHQQLSGVTVPGAAPVEPRGAAVPSTVFEHWEQEKAAGAPELVARFPHPAYPIAHLDGVAVAFWEEVTGVQAGDLTVGGSPATSVEGSGKGPYVFRGFVPVSGSDWIPRGPHGGHAGVPVAIAVGGAGIRDADQNAFAGDSWTLMMEADADGDLVPDSVDNCPDSPNPSQENSDVYAVHGYGSPYQEPGHGQHSHEVVFAGDALGDACDPDDDDDGVGDQSEIAMGSDPRERTSLPDPAELPGDLDGDGVPNAEDGCTTDPRKSAPGECGCEALDRDRDDDGALDCVDQCPDDPSKQAVGDCGCRFPDDANEDGILDCTGRSATPCDGDCDGDGQVAIDEVIRGVNISLGSAGLETCTLMDSNRDGSVAISELIGAVNRALGGCSQA